jgi:hypothetical protein
VRLEALVLAFSASHIAKRTKRSVFTYFEAEDGLNPITIDGMYQRCLPNSPYKLWFTLLPKARVWAAS